MSRPSFIRRFFSWLKKVLIILFLSQLGYILLLRYVNPPITVTQIQSLFNGEGLQREYVSIDEISPSAKLAVIAAEDQLFPLHDGFDWKAIGKAIDHNKVSKRKRGASTISQQVAKNVFLWQGRSWIRKGLEVYFTFMIEWIWGKERILEVYLNVIEMGKGIYGIEAASQSYFMKSATNLTPREAAMIAACLPSPKHYTVKPLSRYVSIRVQWILIQMRNLQGDPEIDKLLADREKDAPTQLGL